MFHHMLKRKCYWTVGHRIKQNLTEAHELNKRDWHFWLKEQKIRHQIPQELFNFTISTDVFYWAANLLFGNQFLQLGLEILHLQKHNQHHAQIAQNCVTRHKGGRSVLRDRKRSASATIWHHPARWPPAPGSSKHTQETKISAASTQKPANQRAKHRGATGKRATHHAGSQPRDRGEAPEERHGRSARLPHLRRHSNDLIRPPQLNRTETPTKKEKKN